MLSVLDGHLTTVTRKKGKQSWQWQMKCGQCWHAATGDLCEECRQTNSEQFWQWQMVSEHCLQWRWTVLTVTEGQWTVYTVMVNSADSNRWIMNSFDIDTWMVNSDRWEVLTDEQWWQCQMISGYSEGCWQMNHDDSVRRSVVTDEQ